MSFELKNFLVSTLSTISGVLCNGVASEGFGLIQNWQVCIFGFGNSLYLTSFKNTILKTIRSQFNLVLGVPSPFSVKFLTTFPMSFSHLREHYFEQNF